MRPKSAPVDGQHDLFGFLTTEANAVVAPIHPKAMPVILTTPEEVDLWLLADVRIPTQSGQGFRFDVGHRSDLIPATIPK